MAKKERVKISKTELYRVLKVFSFIRPYRWAFIGGMLLLVLGSLVFMVFPGAAGEMANVASGKGKFNLSLKDFGWIFLLILLLQGVLSYFRTILFAYVSEKGMASIREAVFEKLITQPISFFDKSKSGELTSYMTTDIEKLQNTFSITLAEFIRQLVILIVGIVVIAWIAPGLSLIMLATFPVIVILAMVFGRYIKRFSRRRQDQLASTNSIAEEAIQNVSVVKSFVNEWLESIRYSGSVQEVVRISLRFARIKGLFFVFIVTVLFGGIFFILWMGALKVQSGDMEVGDLFSFVMYTALMGGAIAGLGNFYTQLAASVGAAGRVLDILESPTEVSPHKVTLLKEDILKGRIQLKNIHFSYPSRKDVEVLKGLNMVLAPGEKAAIVGPSGAGKSTLAQLVLRFYTPDSGEILIDNKDIQNYDILTYRKQVAIVPQEILLFGGTIKENIRYGNPDAQDNEIAEAAEKANAMEFIRQFPKGMDTIVGDRGVRLSGGQRQRIAIARAILKDPRILILDEATSSLDAESEKLVQDALEVLMEGRTSIIIAHRLSTIRSANNIYVLKDGQIVEEGAHETLITKKDGLYHALYRLQSSGIEVL